MRPITISAVLSGVVLMESGGEDDEGDDIYFRSYKKRITLLKKLKLENTIAHAKSSVATASIEKASVATASSVETASSSGSTSSSSSSSTVPTAGLTVLLDKTVTVKAEKNAGDFFVYNVIFFNMSHAGVQHAALEALKK